MLFRSSRPARRAAPPGCTTRRNLPPARAASGQTFVRSPRSRVLEWQQKLNSLKLHRHRVNQSALFCFPLAKNSPCAHTAGASENHVAEEHLIAEVSRRYKAMSRRVRISKIRKLASASPADDRFIRRTFPDLYQEAFQKRRRAAGVRSESTRPQKRAAKRR